MNRGKTDLVWSGWEGLRVWRELVPVFEREAAQVVDRARILGGYVVAGRYLDDRRWSTRPAPKPRAA